MFLAIIVKIFFIISPKFSVCRHQVYIKNFFMSPETPFAITAYKFNYLPVIFPLDINRQPFMPKKFTLIHTSAKKFIIQNSSPTLKQCGLIYALLCSLKQIIDCFFLSTSFHRIYFVMFCIISQVASLTHCFKIFRITIRFYMI